MTEPPSPGSVYLRILFACVGKPPAGKSTFLNSIAENFDVSRQAISLHIKILTECGLISIKKQGRERYCEAKLEKLKEVSAWVENYKTFWNTKLDALEKFLNETNAPKIPSKKKSKRKPKHHGK